MGLFDGTMQKDHRIREVIDMLGHPPTDYESEVMRHFASELLTKAEQHALRWLQNEISECMAGEAAARILKRRPR